MNMLDIPIQNNPPAIVQEYVIAEDVQTTINMYALSETDLSFYDSMGAGLCSSETSCRRHTGS
jgi:hypothetical protein